MIFIHDHTFLKNGDQYYTSGSLNNDLFKRYKKSFINIEIFATERLANSNDIRFIKKQNLVNNVSLSLVKKKSNLKEISRNCKKLEFLIEKQDYIVVRLPSFYGILAIKYAKKYKKPYLIEMVGCPWDAFNNHSWKGKLVAPITWFLTKKSVRNAQYVTYVTNHFLQTRYPTIGKSIGCSDVMLPELQEDIIINRLDKIEALEDKVSIKLGTTAVTNMRYKGQEFVIKAISMLNTEGYNFEYYLAGGGDNSFLKSLVDEYGLTDKVNFMGPLSHSEVFDYLDKIDIYIQPSKVEGLPRSLVEAMSRGCPALGSDVGGIPELLSKNFIFNNGSVEEIYTLLKNLDSIAMKEQAKLNFKKAKDYQAKILENKRINFFDDFTKENL